MKILYFDLETTGVKYWKHGIHQIGGIIEIDGEVKESFNFFVQPHEKAIIEEEALAIAKVQKEDIEKYPKQYVIHRELKDILGKYVDTYDKKDKFFLCGYNNAGFDNDFLRAFFVQCNDKYFGSWFWSSSLDVMVLASNYLKEKRSEMENFKLHTVAKELGIEVDEAKLHDAKYDIELTRAIYKIVE